MSIFSIATAERGAELNSILKCSGACLPQHCFLEGLSPLFSAQQKRGFRGAGVPGMVIISLQLMGGVEQ